jgi:FPC/CPF motif-containing protein YcgG
MGIPENYFAFIADAGFPCIAAKAALARDQVRILVCDHMACPKDDVAIIEFLHSFVDQYRLSTELYHSALLIFKNPTQCSEKEFDHLMWQRLQKISDLDALQFSWDTRVGSDPAKSDFSFSIKEEAFYVIGLHPGSSRKARRFQYPALVFNPHAQFEKLREAERYSAMKQAVRKRDVIFSGSVNPMLADFGLSSEAFQYSGRLYDKDWKCPFKSHHETSQHNTPT